MGRPKKYTPELADRICRRLAEDHLNSVFADPGMPSKQTFYNWLREDPEFFDHSTRARAIAALRELDECDGRFQDAAARDADGKDVNVQLLRELASHSRWKVSKLLPKTYGDRMSHEVTGKDGAALGVMLLPADMDAEAWDDAAELQRRQLEEREAGD